MEKKIPVLGLLSLNFLLSSCQHSSLAQKPKNIIFVIVDGMDPKQVTTHNIEFLAKISGK